MRNVLLRTLSGALALLSAGLAVLMGFHAATSGGGGCSPWLFGTASVLVAVPGAIAIALTRVAGCRGFRALESWLVLATLAVAVASDARLATLPYGYPPAPVQAPVPTLGASAFLGAVAPPGSWCSTILAPRRPPASGTGYRNENRSGQPEARRSH